MKTPALRMPPLRLWRMRRAKYDVLVEKGAFGPDDRVELLDGLIIVREPQGSRHAVVVDLVIEALERDTSLAEDRLRKGGLYARAGVADYWIVNLVGNVREVYRRPERAPSRRFGWKYGSARLLTRSAVISPLVAPRARIRVAALLS